jgi:hypothetical protein
MSTTAKEVRFCNTDTSPFAETMIGSAISFKVSVTAGEIRQGKVCNELLSILSVPRDIRSC